MSRRLSDLIVGVSILGSMVVSAAAVAVVAAVVSHAGSWRWYHWVLVSPLLYVGWLIVFLLISAVVCKQVGTRNPKPRHVVLRHGLTLRSKEVLGLATATMCYRRLAILESIPFVSLLTQFRHFDRLVLRAYSPSVHIGENVANWSVLADPDLTEIGDDVVLGGRATISAHSMVIRTDGALVYVSAPIRIGERATIGAAAYVALGCVVGRDAIVEPGAVVDPFTQIPPGEVWGGNPARFRRMRDDVHHAQTAQPVPAAVESGPGIAPLALRADVRRSPAGPARDEVRQLVVEALGLTPDDAADDLSTDTCSLWDSLGQVAIAAAIFDRYGIAVDGGDVFRLKSLDDIVGFIVQQGGAPTPAAGSEIAATDAVAPPPGIGPAADTAPLPDDLEMLPLLDAQTATRALAVSLDGTPGSGTRLRVNIAASFTAHPIEPTLKLWGRAFGFDIDCRFAGYDQIVQALLDESGALAANGDGVTVVLTRPEDLPPDPSEATSALDQILDAVEQAASERSPESRLLIGTLPPVVSSFTAIERQQSEALRDHWRGRLATMTGVELFDFAHVVERVGIDNARSSQLEVVTRSGYSPRLHQELAIDLVRRIRDARGRPAKVIALDCDNTLWGGVVGEVGRDGLQLSPDGPGRSFQLFQRYLKRLKDRGLLLVVVSKNEEHDVADVFANHPEMVLGPEDIAAWRVNWQPKSESLRELAAELNLGLDSFVLLDDDPATRLEVKTLEPAVHVVPLPADPAAYCETLDRLWLFDGAEVTAVDATRTEKAQDEQRRHRDRGSAVSLEDYLTRLELEVDLGVARDEDMPRVAQLTQRTNQFNLTLKRWTLDEVRALTPDSTVLVLSARDRFGDYGQIGVCVLRPGLQPEIWEIDTLLMSCRALGRGVENAFLHGIATVAEEHGATSLTAAYVTGPRNGQVKDFLARAGFDEIESDRWKLPIQPLPLLPGHVLFRGPRTTPAPAVAAEPVAATTAHAAVSDASTRFVVFEQADVTLFSDASHDRNPLHLSEEYARTTPFGQPVVFGILGTLAALGQLEDEPKPALGIDVEFRQPLFIGVRYRVEMGRTAADRQQVMLWDGNRLALKLAVIDDVCERPAVEPTASERVARSEPIDRSLEEITLGTAVSGSYAPDLPSLDRVLDRWELRSKGLGRDQVAALLWSSYLIGMEVPGKRALFWSLDMRFRPDVPGSETLSYAATVARVDPQLEFVELAADLSARGAAMGAGKTPRIRAPGRGIARLASAAGARPSVRRVPRHGRCRDRRQPRSGRFDRAGAGDEGMHRHRDLLEELRRRSARDREPVRGAGNRGVHPGRRGRRGVVPGGAVSEGSRVFAPRSPGVQCGASHSPARPERRRAGTVQRVHGREPRPRCGAACGAARTVVPGVGLLRARVVKLRPNSSPGVAALRCREVRRGRTDPLGRGEQRPGAFLDRKAAAHAYGSDEHPGARHEAIAPEHVASAILRRLDAPSGDRVEVLETFDGSSG